MKKLIVILMLGMLLLCSCQAKEDLKELGEDALGLIIPEEDNRREKKKVYDDAKEAVTRNLECPATAVFPAYKSNFVSKQDDTWVVSAYVDAQNLMGAMVRMYYQVNITYTAKGYKYELIYEK